MMIYAMRTCSRYALPALTRSVFTQKDRPYSKHQQMMLSTDQEKVERITRTFLPENQWHDYTLSGESASTKELQTLLRQVEENVSIPITHVHTPSEDPIVSHFLDNHTFVNLPYSKKVSQWSDRIALQELIQNQFNLLFENGDLVIIPGCADGQIPIEILVNALQNNKSVDIVGADLNKDAMKLGFCTLAGYGFDPSLIEWVHADISSPPFFDWLSERPQTNLRNRVVTLVQPSLGEKRLLQFLKQQADFARKVQTSTMLVMPALLNDEDTGWHSVYRKTVQEEEIRAQRDKRNPYLEWRPTECGQEALRLSQKTGSYVIQQYFIDEHSLPKIQEITGYTDVSDLLFEPMTNGTQPYQLQSDPRIIKNDQTKRHFCIWEVDGIDSL